MVTTFKTYLTESKKGITREQAKDLYRIIKRQLNPEQSQDTVMQNGEWWDLMIRDYKYFTPRPGEEDDDWPDFTGEKELKRGLSTIMKGLEYTYSPEEKDWITISVKAKKLNKAEQKRDMKKKTVDVVNAVGRLRYLTSDNWARKFYEAFYEILVKKHKKKFITKAQYFELQSDPKISDDEAAQEGWDLA